jgi:hypothetical protein
VLFRSCAETTRVVSHLKKFALAGKFFEYIFEPALASQNSIFYGVGFHLFIANLLFVYLNGQDTPAEEMFLQFSRFMREGDRGALQKLFPSKGLVVDTSDPLEAISLFAMLNRDAIVEELENYHDGSTPNWILDLTTTSLFGALQHWGERFDELEVFCDRSKPLEAEHDSLKAMVGRTDHFRVNMFGKDRQYTFNLVQIPQLVDSMDHHGIQIADVFASAVAKAQQNAYRGQADESDREWLSLVRESMLPDNIWPDLRHADPRGKLAFVNGMLLIELASRCVQKQDLFEGIPELIAFAHEAYPQYRANMRSDSSARGELG